MVTTLNELTDADFADIGRALVAHAVQQREKKELTVDGEGRVKAATLRVYLRYPQDLSHESPQIRSAPCCVCFLEYDVVICKGPCCEDW